MARGCSVQLQQLMDSCHREIGPAAPEDKKLLQQRAMQNRNAFAAQCTDPQSQAGVKQLDACIAQGDAAVAEESHDAEPRRRAETPKAEALKADPKYVALRDRFKHSQNQETMACESARNAREDKSPNLATWQQQCDEFKRQADGDAGELRTMIETHGIDVRDGRALGLWP